MAYKAVANGVTHKDLIIGGQKHKAVYAGSKLIWEKGEDDSKYLGVFKFRYKDFLYFLTESAICDVDYGDGVKKEDYSEFLHETTGSHICTVYIKEFDQFISGPLIRWIGPEDGISAGRYNGITEAISDFPKVVDGNGENTLGTTGAFSNCFYLTKVPDTIFKNLTGSYSYGETFSGCGSLQSVSEKVYSFIKNNPTDFNDHFHKCESLVDAPKLYEMFPNVYGRRCYDFCKKLPYYKEIPFPWRTDFVVEDLVEVITPTGINDAVISGGKVQFSARIKLDLFKFATDATVSFKAGYSGLDGQQSYKPNTMTDGLVSGEVVLGRDYRFLNISVYAGEQNDPQYEIEEMYITKSIQVRE